MNPVLVVSQIQVELRASEGPELGPSFSEPTRPLDPSPEVMAILSCEMENMVIEHRLKRDPGPLQSAAQAAVLRRYHSEPPPARSSLATLGIPSPSPTLTPTASPPPPAAGRSERIGRSKSRDSVASASTSGASVSSSYARGRSSSY